MRAKLRSDLRFRCGKSALLLVSLLLAAIPGWAGPDAQSDVPALAQVIQETFPSVAAQLQGSATFSREEREIDGRRMPGLRAVEAGLSVGSWYPARFDGSFVVEQADVQVSVRASGGFPVQARVRGGRIEYLQAFEHTDALYVPGARRSEEFLLLRSPKAPRRFEYVLDGLRGISRVFEADGAIHLAGPAGTGLTIEKPWLIDAEGRRTDTATRFELDPEDGTGARRFSLVLDPTGLSYPLLVDPSFTVIQPGGGGSSHSTTLLQTGLVLIAGGGSGTNTQCSLYDPSTGIWTVTSPMSQSRYQHTATMLRNGKVLVAGGLGPSGALATAELFDPVTRTWSAAGSMTVARRLHTATLLADGRVLVVAGITTASWVATAELYNPSTNTWTATGSLQTARYRHTASLLRNPQGQVLVVAGTNASIDTGALASAELYDPPTGTWSATGSLTNRRNEHAAVTLTNGNVLVMGGSASSVFTRQSEIYNTGTGTWSPGPQLVEPGRLSPSATVLPNGTVLVAGGNGTSTFLNTAELFNGTSFVATVSMTTAREMHGATLLPNGKVLITAGWGGTGFGTNLGDAELYDSSAASWVAGVTMGTARTQHTATLLRTGQVLAAGGTTSELMDDKGTVWGFSAALGATPRSLHSATLLVDGRVLVTGGTTGSTALRTALLYNPSGNSWSATGDMISLRQEHTATLLPDGRVLVTGGFDGTGPLSTAEVFDPLSGTWSATGSLGSARRQHTATLLTDGRVLVAGGLGASGALASSELYSTTGGTWANTTGAPAARYGHTATLLPTGFVLVAGGFNGTSTLATTERFNPATGAWVTAGTMTGARWHHTATLMIDGRVLVAGGNNGTAAVSTAEIYDPATPAFPFLGVWSATANMGVVRESHTATLLTGGTVLLTGGLSGPAVASTRIHNLNIVLGTGAQPLLGTVTTPLPEGSALTATGTRFQGLTEAYGGASDHSSATNYPVVQLRRLDNELVRWLPAEPFANWSATTFRSAALTGLQPGPARAILYTNGIPSITLAVSVECTPPTVTLQPTPQNVCAGGTATFASAASGTNPGFRWRKNGVPLADGGHVTGSGAPTLTVSSVDSSDVAGYDMVASLACSTSPATSAPAGLSLTPPLSSVSINVSGSTSVCYGSGCTGGTASLIAVGGGTLTHQWGYREVTGGPVTPITGQTSAVYTINGAHFPAPGAYLLVVTSTPACGSPVTSNEIRLDVTFTTEPGFELPLLTTTSKDQQDKVEWLNPTGPFYVSTLVRYNPVPMGSSCTPVDFPADPASGFLLAHQAGSPDQPDWAMHGGANNGQSYCYAGFVYKGGGKFSLRRTASGQPFDTTGLVKWSFNTGSLSVMPPGLNGFGYVVSDDALYAVRLGSGGGDWPAGWKPFRFAGSPPALTRPTVSGVTVGTSTRVLLVGTQDGRVQALDAVTGAPLWLSVPLNTDSMIQAGVSGLFKKFAGASAPDVVLAGTLNAVTPNSFAALDLSTGGLSSPYTFTNDVVQGGDGLAMGVVGGQATVDSANMRAYFASRRRSGGSANTLWCVELKGGIATYKWARALDDIDGSPILRDATLYVGTNTGTIHALDAATGATRWSFTPAIPDGAVKGFIWAIRGTNRLYYSTDDQVWALDDSGTSTPPASETWTIPVQSPSVPVFSGSYLYVGSGDGSLYQIDAAGGTRQVQLGDGTALVGTPSFDFQNSLVYVGSASGQIYAVAAPLP